MAMNVVITRNVSDRIRGFLASSMLEIAPGVYFSNSHSPAVRQRILEVLNEWFFLEEEASIVSVWKDYSKPGGLAMKRFGLPPLDLVEMDGLLVTRRSKKKEPAHKE